jgi:hypothetical protein
LTVVNVALPTTGRKLPMPESDLQWVVTGYALTFGGFLLLGGAIGVAIASTIAATKASTLLHQGAAPAAALTSGFQWALWACGLIGLAGVPVTVLLLRRNELARAVASTTMTEPKPAPATVG